MRIKFFVGENIFTSKQTGRAEFNPAYYFLKSYYKKVGKFYDNYTWLQTEYLLDPIPELIKRVEDEKAEILCFSMFIWNWEYYIKFIKAVKEKHPNLIIIVGGPEVHPERDKDFFKNHPYIDYAVYNEGEHAFSNLLDSFYDSDGDYNFTNLATVDRIHPYKMFKFTAEPKFNAYLDFKDEFVKDFDLLRSQGFTRILVAYERVKGCPYKCSFCDWHQGNHKINVRSNDWKDELDFFSTINADTYVMDANFGIFEEDLKLFEYALDLHKKNNKFRLGISNVAKLHKDRVYWLYDKWLENDPKERIKISLQDLDADVLSNIDRPEIPWEEHKKYIVDLKEKHKHNKPWIQVELINGLPGSTREKILYQFTEFADLQVADIRLHYWIMLIGSPAYNETYRREQNIDFVNTFMLHDKDIFVDDLDNIQLTDDVIREGHFLKMLYDKNLGLDGLLYHYMISEFYIALAKKYDFGQSLNKEIFINSYAKYKSTLNLMTEKVKKELMTIDYEGVPTLFWAVKHDGKLFGVRHYFAHLMKKLINLTS